MFDELCPRLNSHPLIAPYSPLECNLACRGADTAYDELTPLVAVYVVFPDRDDSAKSGQHADSRRAWRWPVSIVPDESRVNDNGSDEFNQTGALTSLTE